MAKSGESLKSAILGTKPPLREIHQPLTVRPLELLGRSALTHDHSHRPHHYPAGLAQPVMPRLAKKSEPGYRARQRSPASETKGA